jgi:hypothetical protein
MLGVVNQQSGGPIPASLGHERIQQQPFPLLGVQAIDRQLQAGAEVIEDVGKIEIGVDQPDELDVVRLRDAAPQHQGLADPGFTGQQDEPAPLPDAVQDVGARGIEIGVPVIVLRVLRFEGFTVKTEVGGIHCLSPRRRRPLRNGLWGNPDSLPAWSTMPCSNPARRDRQDRRPALIVLVRLPPRPAVAPVPPRNPRPAPTDRRPRRYRW